VGIRGERECVRGCPTVSIGRGRTLNVWAELGDSLQWVGASLRGVHVANITKGFQHCFEN